MAALVLFGKSSDWIMHILLMVIWEVKIALELRDIFKIWIPA
jgi:hypothetical protein